MTGGRIAALIVGILIALIGALFAFAGYAISNAEQFVEPVETDGRAVVIDVGALAGDTDLSDEDRAEFGDFDVTFLVDGDRDLFVGRATVEDIEDYLDGVPHLVIDFSEDSVTSEVSGSRSIDPGSESFWLTSVEGHDVEVMMPLFPTEEQQLVVMNRDGSPNVLVNVGFDFSSLPFVGTFAAVALGGGIFAVVFGLGLAAWAIITRKKDNETVPDPLGYDT